MGDRDAWLSDLGDSLSTITDPGGLTASTVAGLAAGEMPSVVFD